MEHLLAQCSISLPAHYPLIISVVLGGLIGSISHCSAMCSPVVAAQMLMLQPAHRSSSPIWFYHAGRISTYMLLGIVACESAQWIFGTAFASISHVMLLLAGITFFISALLPAKTHACCSSRTRTLQQWMAKIPWPALRYYARGVLMGFMPCGLLLSVMLMVSTVSSVGHAAMVMLTFGLSTVPVLHLAAATALSLGNRYPNTGARLGRIAMAGNGIFLCGIGLNLVRVS